MRICYSGIKFFLSTFCNAIGTSLTFFTPGFEAGPEKKLPCVLSKSEIDLILKNVRTFHNRVFLTTVYSCGLRLQEVLYLQVCENIWDMPNWKPPWCICI